MLLKRVKILKRYWLRFELDTNVAFLITETVFKVVNEEHDKLEAKKKAKHQNSITGKL